GIRPRFAFAFYATRFLCLRLTVPRRRKACAFLKWGKLLNKQNPRRHSYSECSNRQILLRATVGELRPAAQRRRAEEVRSGPEQGARNEPVLGYELGSGDFLSVFVLRLEHLDSPALSGHEEALGAYF